MQSSRSVGKFQSALLSSPLSSRKKIQVHVPLNF